MEQNKEKRTTKIIWIVFFIIGLLGFADTLYLTYTRLTGASVNCSILNGCEKVLASNYAQIYGLPLALIGVLYYLAVLTLAAAYLTSRKTAVLKIILGLSFLGFLVSLWLVYLQIFVLDSLCLYCLFSALASTILFILAVFFIKISKTPLNLEV